MAKFKLIISDPSSGKSQVAEIEGAKAHPLIGRKMGEVIDGSIAGLSGRQLQITGGSDKDGVPMRADVRGGARVGVILSGGVGFHFDKKGERRRKMIRGNTVTEDIVQLNLKFVEKTLETRKTEEKKPESASK